MTNLKEEISGSNELKIQAAGGESSGSDSDKDLKTSSISSCSSSSSGTTSKLAIRMADKVSLSSSPAEKRFKFEPNEDYLDQLLAMGISSNGARKVSNFFDAMRDSHGLTFKIVVDIYLTSK